jgi:esterase
MIVSSSLRRWHSRIQSQPTQHVASLSRSAGSGTVPLAFTPATTPSASGAPVVFLHGLLGSATNFRTIQLSTARSRPTYAFDLRNHGRSPHASGASLDALAGDVAAALETSVKSAAGAATIVGHSLGGKVGMRLAQTRPELVGGLVVIDIAPVTYTGVTNSGWKSVQGVVRAAAALDPAPYRTRAQVEAALAEHVPEPGVRSFVAQNLVPQANGAAGFAWRVYFPAILAALDDYASYPPAPAVIRGTPRAPPAGVHFIAGELSPYIGPQHRDAIQSLFPGASMHVVAGAGHWVHADRPREFWSLLARVLGIQE